MRKLFLFLCSIICASVFAANGNLIFTQDKPNAVISKSQPTFTVKLKSNPTTGYSWFLADYDDELITPVKHQYEAPTGQLVGASGYEYWTFKVKPAAFVVPHQTVLEFNYARPWEKKDSATQFEFTVTTQAE